MEWIYRAGVWTTVAALRLLARWEVTGRENVPKDGPLIVAANHASYLDPPLLAASIGRRMRFLAQAGLFKHPLIGPLVRGAGALRVERDGQASFSALKVIRELKRGSAIGVFPEGHRNLDGVLGKGKPGMAYVAFKSGALVLPVGVTGTHRVRSVKDVMKRPRLSVKIGKPLPFWDKRPEREQLDAFTDLVMVHIAALLPLDQRGVYSQQSQGVIAASAGKG